MNLREAAQQALEALDGFVAKELTFGQRYTNEAQALLDSIHALRTALAEPEQEPVAWGMPRPDGQILDVITPEEHARVEGAYTVPLYRRDDTALLRQVLNDLCGSRLCSVNSMSSRRLTPAASARNAQQPSEQGGRLDPAEARAH